MYRACMTFQVDEPPHEGRHGHRHDDGGIEELRRAPSANVQCRGTRRNEVIPDRRIDRQGLVITHQRRRLAGRREKPLITKVGSQEHEQSEVKSYRSVKCLRRVPRTPSAQPAAKRERSAAFARFRRQPYNEATKVIAPPEGSARPLTRGVHCNPPPVVRGAARGAGRAEQSSPQRERRSASARAPGGSEPPPIQAHSTCSASRPARAGRRRGTPVLAAPETAGEEVVPGRPGKPANAPHPGGGQPEPAAVEWPGGGVVHGVTAREHARHGQCVDALAQSRDTGLCRGRPWPRRPVRGR